MATKHNLNGVPGGSEIWRDTNNGRIYLMWLVPQTGIPMIWMVPDWDTWTALSQDVPGLNFHNVDEAGINRVGAIRAGMTTELSADVGKTPFAGFVENYNIEAAVNPMMRDSQVMGIYAQAMIEGRTPTQAELEATQYWRMRTPAQREVERQAAGDPGGFYQRVTDNRLMVSRMLEEQGISNPSQYTIDQVADPFSNGEFAGEEMLRDQVRKASDPYTEGTTFFRLTGQTTEGLFLPGHMEAQQLVEEWLGPQLAKQWTHDMIGNWASRIRANPAQKDTLVDTLRRQRLAALPEWEDPNMTYNDIALMARNMVQNVWGTQADETEPYFMDLMRTKDTSTQAAWLRTEGMKRGIGKVHDEALGQMEQVMGGQVMK